MFLVVRDLFESTGQHVESVHLLYAKPVSVHPISCMSLVEALSAAWPLQVPRDSGSPLFMAANILAWTLAKVHCSHTFNTSQVMQMEAESESTQVLVAGDNLEKDFARLESGTGGCACSLILCILSMP